MPSSASDPPKTRTVLLPSSSAFTLNGLRRIETLTQERWHRLQFEREGTDALIRLLKEDFGLVVGYDAQLGMLMVGRTDSIDGKMVFFGRPMLRLAQLMEQSGKPWGEEALAYASQYVREWMPGSQTDLKDFRPRPGYGAHLVVSFTLVPQDGVARRKAARLATAKEKTG